MSFKRVKIIVSSEIFEIVYSKLSIDNNLAKFISWLNNLYEEVLKFKNTFILLMPTEYKYYHKDIESFFNKIENSSQVNIIPVSYETNNSCLCNSFHITNIVDDYAKLPFQYILNECFFKNYPLPFMVGFNRINYDKNKCDCDKKCKERLKCINFLIEDFNSKELINKFLLNYCKDFMLKNDLSIENVRDMLILISNSVCNEESDKDRISGYEFFDSFITKINRLDFHDKELILKSLFRAMAYPSINQSSKRVNFSIDYHYSDKKTINNVIWKLFRVDVVDENSNGKRSSGTSGTKRLLIVKSKLLNRKIVLDYTSKHDFSNSEIIKLLNEIE